MARTSDPHAATVKAWQTRARETAGGTAVQQLGDFAGRSDREVIRGKFLNEGKVSVRFPGGSTNFHAKEEDAHAEADRMIAERGRLIREHDADSRLIEAAISGRSTPDGAEDALARAMRGRTPSTADITGLIRTRYGTTIAEARKHASRITGSKSAFTDSAGTSRAHVSAVIEYLRVRGKEIQGKD